MKKTIYFYTYLLLFITTFSCNGQEKTEPRKEIAPQVQQVETKLPQKDPYFTVNNNTKATKGPVSITRNIIQDQKGHLWFATYEGLVRYDGTTFKNFTTNEGLEPFRIFALLEDSNEFIWVGTLGAGLYRFDGKAFVNFTTENGLVANKVSCFMETKRGDIWIGTMQGISKFDGTSFSDFTIKGGQDNNDINSIIEDRSGKLWIGTRGEAHFFDGKAFNVITNATGESFENVRTIIEDQKGNVWLGGNDGLWSYDGTSYTNYSKNFTGGIYQDGKGNIWTSSAANSDGNSRSWALTKFDSLAQANKGATAIQIKSEENMFFGMTEDKNGNMWFGHLRGVYRYDGQSFTDFR